MPDHVQANRRQFIAAGAVTASGLVLPGAMPASGQGLAPTPECGEGDAPTPPQTAGPFYKPRSPQRADLIEPGMQGRVLELAGAVLTRACRPVPGALIDLWHADDEGEYDQRGFRCRGHQFADAQGRYRFRTIVPEIYTGRTRHYHVRVQAPNGPLLTTQLYFPGEPLNRRDGLFRRELLMRVSDAGGGAAARFDFVLAVG